MCIGDFNDILYPWEKTSKRPTDKHCMQTFCQMVNDCSLMEVPSKGCSFTWTNNRNGDECVKEKLDRVFCTMDWRLTFPAAEAFALPPLGSDHSPILLTIVAELVKRRKTFYFESFWLQDPGCRITIAASWQGSQIKGQNLPQKFKAVSMALSSWS